MQLEQHEQLPLLKLLSQWSSSIQHDPRRGLVHRAINTFRGTKVSLALGVLTVLLYSVDAVTGSSSEEGNVYMWLSYAFGLSSCLAAEVFFVSRLHHARLALAYLRVVAQAVEHRAGPREKADLSRTARRGRLAFRLHTGYEAVLLLGCVNSLYTDTGSRVSAWLGARATGLPGLLMVMQIYEGTCGIHAYYMMLSLLLLVYNSASSLHRALAANLQEMTGDSLVGLQRVHWHLRESTVIMDAMFRDLYPFFMGAVLLLPLLGTADIVSGQHVSSIALSTFPSLFVVFVPICVAGQGLQDASEFLSWSTFFGPWLSENGTERRRRLQVLTMASRTARVTMHGFGPLDFPACLAALRGWFSFLQVLLSFSNGTPLSS